MKAFVDEHNELVFRKPGQENQVVDASSPQNINALDNSELSKAKSHLPKLCNQQKNIWVVSETK